MTRRKKIGPTFEDILNMFGEEPAAKKLKPRFVTKPAPSLPGYDEIYPLIADEMEGFRIVLDVYSDKDLIECLDNLGYKSLGQQFEDIANTHYKKKDITKEDRAYLENLYIALNAEIGYSV